MPRSRPSHSIHSHSHCDSHSKKNLPLEILTLCTSIHSHCDCDCDSEKDASKRVGQYANPISGLKQVYPRSAPPFDSKNYHRLRSIIFSAQGPGIRGSLKGQKREGIGERSFPIPSLFCPTSWCLRWYEPVPEQSESTSESAVDDRSRRVVQTVDRPNSIH